MFDKMMFDTSLMVFNIMVSYTPTTYSSVHIFQSKNNNILFVVYVSMALAGRGNITTFGIMEKGKEAFFAALTNIPCFCSIFQGAHRSLPTSQPTYLPLHNDLTL